MNRVTNSKKTQKRVTLSATRIVASTIGGITSAAGVMHGYFEILQGNSASSGLIINAIGPEQRVWAYAALHAFTLIPDFIVTGILAIVFGILATLWAVALIDRKSGPWGMFLLSMVLVLVGGGSGPLFNGTLASLIATRLNKPPAGVPASLYGARNFFAKLWPGVIILWMLLFLAAVETTIFGQPLNLFFDANTTHAIVLAAGNVTLPILLLSILSAFAHDLYGFEQS